MSVFRRVRFAFSALERMRLGGVLILAAFVILASAAIYSILPKVGLGGLSRQIGNAQATDSIYFSIVTFTSLGYGNVTPTGGARWVACAEVLVGLLLFGLAVSKASASRQGYYLGRLYSNYSSERFTSYRRSLQTLRGEFRLLMSGSDVQSSKIDQLIVRLQGTLLSVQAFVEFETSEGDFFREIPPHPVMNVLSQMAKLAKQLNGGFSLTPRFPGDVEVLKKAQRRLVQMRRVILLVHDAASSVPEIRAKCDSATMACDDALVGLSTLQEIRWETSYDAQDTASDE